MKFPGLLAIAYKLCFVTFHDMNYTGSVHLMVSRERQLSWNFSGEEGSLCYAATVGGTVNGTLHGSVTADFHH